MRFFQRRTKVKPTGIFLCVDLYADETENIMPLRNQRDLVTANVSTEFPEGVSEGESKC
jgi:hypothetical protein